ncbi:cytochrome c, partial [Vibrio parahaemolyticus]|nr:cytochrome c [Vibrio parahaemolyticus]
MLRFVLLISFIFSSAIHAEPFGDADKGKIKSPSCVYCHGVTGIATNNTYPSLAGQ